MLNFFKKSIIGKTVRCLVLFVCLFLFVFLAFGDKLDIKYFTANTLDSLSDTTTSLLASSNKLGMETKYFTANILGSISDITTSLLAFGDRLGTDIKYFTANISDSLLETTTPATDTPIDTITPTTDTPIDVPNESTDSLFDLLVDIIISSTDAPDENSLIDTTTPTTDTPEVTQPEPEPEIEKKVSVDQNAPYVSKVSSPILEGTFKSGIVLITVSFNEAVTVLGKPQLIISTGDPSTTIATYKSHSKNLLFFQYRISPGNYSSKLDYSSSSALILNGGEIKDRAGNDAVLTLPQPGSLGSLSTYNNIIIDATK